MTRRLDERTKQLHGTAHKRPAAPSASAPRLMRPIPPPRDMAPEIKRQWKMHMAMVVASGCMSSIDLLAFRQLCHTAHAVDVAHEQAMRDGPVERGQQERKVGVSWRAWLVTMGQYRDWLNAFGLTPRGRNSLPQLAVPMPELHVIAGGSQ